MKTKWIIGLMAVAVLASCGGDQKEEESTDNKDTVADVKDTTPVYVYKYQVAEEDLKPSWWVNIGDSTSMATMEKFFMKNTITLKDFMKKSKLGDAPLQATYEGWHETKNFFAKVGYPVADSTIKVKGNLKVERTYGGKVVKTTFTGFYDQMMAAYGDIMHYIEEKKLTPIGGSWEVYVKNQDNEADTTKWETIIYMPVK